MTGNNKKSRYFLYAVFILTAFLPAVSSAAPSDFKELIGIIINIANQLAYLGMGVASLAFLWGVATFILKAGSAELEDAKNKMFWGIVALFVMFSVWGIIRLIAVTFEIAL